MPKPDLFDGKSTCPYKIYYLAQAQSGGAVSHFYQGAPFQKGHGLGSLFYGLFRWASTLLVKGAKFFGKQALGVGSKILNDAVAGENITTSAKRRLEEAIQNVMSGQSGSGSKRRNKRRKTTARSRKTTARTNALRKTRKRTARRRVGALARKTRKLNVRDIFSLK